LGLAGVWPLLFWDLQDVLLVWVAAGRLSFNPVAWQLLYFLIRRFPKLLLRYIPTEGTFKLARFCWVNCWPLLGLAKTSSWFALRRHRHPEHVKVAELIITVLLDFNLFFALKLNFLAVIKVLALRGSTIIGPVGNGWPLCWCWNPSIMGRLGYDVLWGIFYKLKLRHNWLDLNFLSDLWFVD
jgi:hypothetical protein